MASNRCQSVSQLKLVHDFMNYFVFCSVWIISPEQQSTIRMGRKRESRMSCVLSERLHQILDIVRYNLVLVLNQYVISASDWDCCSHSCSNHSYFNNTLPVSASCEILSLCWTQHDGSHSCGGALLRPIEEGTINSPPQTRCDLISDYWTSKLQFLHLFRESWPTLLLDVSAAESKKWWSRPTLRRRCQITTKPRTLRPTHRHPTTPPPTSPQPTAAIPAACRTCSRSSNKETPPTSRPPSECQGPTYVGENNYSCTVPRLSYIDMASTIYAPTCLCVRHRYAAVLAGEFSSCAKMSPLNSVQQIQTHTPTSTGLNPEGGQHRCFGKALRRFHPVSRRPEQL